MSDISENMQCIYDLNKLMQPFDFVTEPADGIKRVEIISITLESLVGDNIIVIERPLGELKSIFAIAQEVLKTNDPLEDSFTLIRVTLLFSFFPYNNFSSEQMLSVILTKHGECIVSNKTAYNSPYAFSCKKL